MLSSCPYPKNSQKGAAHVTKTGPWLQILISVGLLAVMLFWLVDLKAAARELADADWAYLGWLALWLTGDRLLMTYKWRLLVVCRGLALGLGEALRVYYVATFAGCFLPSTVGADALRVAVLTRPDRPSAALAASVVVERALGFVAAALAAAVGLGLLASLALHLPDRVRDWSLGVLSLAVLAVMLTLTGPLAARLEDLPQRVAGRGKMLRWLARFLSSCGVYRHHRGALLVFVLLSFVEQWVPAVGCWLLARALDLPLSLPAALAVTPLAMLFARLPVSASGFGVVEGLFVAFFNLVGLHSTESFLLGFMLNLSSLATALPGAWFYARGGLRGLATSSQPGDQPRDQP